MSIVRSLALVACTVAIAALAACSGTAGPGASVEPQLEEAKNLNVSLSAQWQSFDTTMASTLKVVDELPAMSVPAKKLDVELLRKALSECFEAPVQAGAAAAAGGAAASGEGVAPAPSATPKCDTESTHALKDLAQKGDPEVAAFINAKLDSIALMRSNIKDRLPALAADIAEQYAQAKIRVDEIRVDADKRKGDADANPDMSQAEKAEFQAQYDALQTELNKLDELLKKMEADGMNLPDKVRVTLEKATYALSTFGQN